MQRIQARRCHYSGLCLRLAYPCHQAQVQPRQVLKGFLGIGPSSVQCWIKLTHQWAIMRFPFIHSMADGPTIGVHVTGGCLH
jgi:hypothetical protein